jgi:diaminohydroxyphosphoribosylaminopyrimidine deaminase/5-amino-6-(5-phosphoribosylamino)uracil reductase
MLFMNDEFYMKLAIDTAWRYQLLTYPNPAVGAVVVCRGQIVAVEAHRKAGTSHAEVLALVSAYERLSGQRVDFDPMDAVVAHDFLRALPQNFFSRCTIYVTLEPCSHSGKTPSCADLLVTLQLERVVIALADPIAGHGGGAARLENVTMGVLEEAARDLIAPFLVWQERAFVLFKIAQTLNGRIGGGYLSSHASLEHVHAIRSVANRLIIGGHTVRTDRPTLDSRFVLDGQAPDVTIFSHRDDFDRSIPLFGVPGRHVAVSSALECLDKPSLVLVEGGGGMLEAMHGHIDWMLSYLTPKLSDNEITYNTPSTLRFLHAETIDVDMMIWSQYRGD